LYFLKADHWVLIVLPPMRITTWNVRCGKNINAISRAFIRHPNLAESDVILLQEIESHPREGKSRAELIAERIGYYCVYAPSRQTKDRGNHGIAVLSRFPIAHTEVVDLPFFSLPFRSRNRIGLITSAQARTV